MQDLPNGDEKKIAKDNGASVVVRHLSLIKALAIIMAVLIVTALVVIVVTIYSRLQAGSSHQAKTEINIVIPKGAYVSAASSNKSGMVLVVDIAGKQQIWRVSSAGRITQKIILQAD